MQDSIIIPYHRHPVSSICVVNINQLDFGEKADPAPHTTPTDKVSYQAVLAFDVILDIIRLVNTVKEWIKIIFIGACFVILFIKVALVIRELRGRINGLPKQIIVSCTCLTGQIGGVNRLMKSLIRIAWIIAITLALRAVPLRRNRPLLIVFFNAGLYNRLFHAKGGHGGCISGTLRIFMVEFSLSREEFHWYVWGSLIFWPFMLPIFLIAREIKDGAAAYEAGNFSQRSQSFFEKLPKMAM